MVGRNDRHRCSARLFVIQTQVVLACASLIVLAACNDPPEAFPVSPQESYTPPPTPQKQVLHDANSPLDFASICEGKAPTSGAAAYAKTPGQVSPLVLLTDYGQGHKAGYSEPLRPWRPKRASDAQLVACSRVQTKSKVRECRFDQSAPVRFLELYDATYTVSLHETATGTKLAEKIVETKASGCPMFHTFSGERDELYPSLNLELVELVSPFQPEDAPPLKISLELLRTVCSGKGLNGAAAYEKGKGPLKIFYRESETEGFNRHFFSSKLYKQARSWDQAAQNDYSAYPVVACITGISKEQHRSCPFSGGKKLEVHGATYTVDIVEAKTGTKLGTRKIQTSPGRCPFTHDFGKGTATLADPGESLARYLTKFASASE